MHRPIQNYFHICNRINLAVALTRSILLEGYISSVQRVLIMQFLQIAQLNVFSCLAALYLTPSLNDLWDHKRATCGLLVLGICGCSNLEFGENVFCELIFTQPNFSLQCIAKKSWAEAEAGGGGPPSLHCSACREVGCCPLQLGSHRVHCSVEASRQTCLHKKGSRIYNRFLRSSHTVVSEKPEWWVRAP